MLGIRHNMITLLYAAKGHLENHLCRIDASSFISQADQLTSAEATLQKVYSLLTRTLDIVRSFGQRIKTAPKRPYTSHANLRDTWASIARQLPVEVKDKAIQSSVSVPYNFPELSCDPKDLEEVLGLLVQNSIDAFSTADAVAAGTTIAWPNKRIVLRAEIGLSQNEPRAIITVADNGPGMSQESIGQIFQPFYSTRLEQGGNGLGLYLANQLITKNNGTIRASSFEGCGCTFVIELPIASTSQQLSERVA